MLEGKRVAVVSQPMYFPWCGVFDQIRLSDTFVFYDDVQLSRGFYNRVQIKTDQGPKMITVPLAKRHRDQKINESLISYDENWVARHRSVIINAYRKTKYLADALSIFDEVTRRDHELLSQLATDSIMTAADYLGLNSDKKFILSSSLDVGGKSSQRLFDISHHLSAEIYLSGHGGLRYLNHEIFDSGGIEVRYMNYWFRTYDQMHGSFDPYVSMLDAIAHLGPSAAEILESTTLNWREAIERSSSLRP